MEKQWDQLSDIETVPEDPPYEDADEIGPGLILSAVLCDLVLILSMITAMASMLLVRDYALDLKILPWAGIVAWVWWLMVGMICLRVLRATPGMWMANLNFSETIYGWRLGSILGAVSTSLLFLGFPLILGGSRNSLLARAAGTPLTRRSVS